MINEEKVRRIVTYVSPGTIERPWIPCYYAINTKCCMKTQSSIICIEYDFKYKLFVLTSYVYKRLFEVFHNLVELLNQTTYLQKRHGQVIGSLNVFYGFECLNKFVTYYKIKPQSNFNLNFTFFILFCSSN